MQDQCGNHAGRARVTATGTMERARDAASHAAHTAMDLCRYAAAVADSASAEVGQRIESMAGSLRDKGPHEGMMGTAASTVAKALERGGRCLQGGGLSGIADGLTDLVGRTLTAVGTRIDGDFHHIIKHQLALFKAELLQDLHKARRPLGTLACGVVLLLLGSVLIGFTAVHLLEWAFRPHLELWVCHLVVGSVVAVIGGGLTYYAWPEFRSVTAGQPGQSVERNLERKTEPN
jgi:hypothetical protein